MLNDVQKLHAQVNQAIVRCRRVYSMWAKENKVSYNRMLVLYTIREYGFCTQKQVCDSYLLPPQTINHVITQMRKEAIIEVDKDKSCGKEKAFVLTQSGEAYAEKLLYSLDIMEERAAKRLGKEKIYRMTQLFMEYNQVLEESLEDEETSEEVHYEQ